jgi:hypothetical protein
MADVNTELTAVKADLDAVKTDFVAIATGIGTLNNTIKTLQGQIAAGTVDPAAVAALLTESDALKTTADGIVAGFAPPTPPAA